jgi:iron transport multicopper oxidase
VQINQSGTYWYHAHNRGQYPDGLRGPLVVHDSASPYKDQYDEEIILTVSDWYYQQMPSQIKTYLSHSENESGGMPTPNATLLNDSQNIKFNFKPGKTYLVRIISMAAFTTHLVHFDQHLMKIVEIDGVYTEPSVADSLAVTSAQRYSVLIQARNNTNQNFAFSSTMAPQQFASPPVGVQTTVYGTLVYNDMKPMPLSSNSTALPKFNVTDDFGLVPTDHQPLLGPVDHRVTLNVNLVTMNGTNRSARPTAQFAHANILIAMRIGRL